MEKKSLDIKVFRVCICRNEGEEDFISKKLYEVGSYEKLFAEKVIYFLFDFFKVCVFSVAF